MLKIFYSYRSFHPDFLLVRQNVKDASEDYRNLLLGFQYGGIPSVNSLQSIYNFQVQCDLSLIFNQSILKLNLSDNDSLKSIHSLRFFQDKPWVYGHMIQVQRKLGKETFPLVNQSYYPNHFELVRRIKKSIFNQLKIAFSVESSFQAKKAFSIFCSISYF